MSTRRRFLDLGYSAITVCTESFEADLGTGSLADSCSSDSSCTDSRCVIGEIIAGDCFFFPFDVFVCVEGSAGVAER